LKNNTKIISMLHESSRYYCVVEKQGKIENKHRIEV